MEDAATQTNTEEPKDVLAPLRQPVPLELTAELKREKEELKKGREFWELVLLNSKIVMCRRIQFADQTPKYWPQYTCMWDDEFKDLRLIPEERHASRTLRGGVTTFFDLPQDIRIRIYGMYLDAHLEEPYKPASYTVRTQMKRDSYRSAGLSMSALERRAGGSWGGHHLNWNPRQQRYEWEKVIIPGVVDSLMEELNRTGEGTSLVYQEYMDEYLQPYRDAKDQAWDYKRPGLYREPHRYNCTACHENVQKSPYGAYETEVKIDCRGNLLECLPLVCLASTLAFADTWTMYFAVHPTYQVDIYDFNFRPLYRFCRMLKRLYEEAKMRYGDAEDWDEERWATLKLTRWEVVINLCFSNDDIDIDMVSYDSYLSDSEDSKEQAAKEGRGRQLTNRFKNLKRTFLYHWLYGFPLWHPEENDDEVPKPSLLGHWMHIVRQAAALYRLDAKSWDAITRQSIQQYIQLWYRGSKEIGEGARLIVDTVQMIAEAAQTRMGIARDWDDKEDFHDGDEYVDCRLDEDLYTYQTRFKVLRLVHRYHLAVDRALRSKLGDSYEEWENLSWDETVPDVGVV